MRNYLFLLFLSITTFVSSQVASIPFEKEGLVYIPVKIGEKETPLTFVFDTGASTAVIDKTVAKRIGIKADTKQYATGASGSQEYEIALNRTLTIANLDFNRLNFVLVDLEELNNRSSMQIDGIIGYDVIKEFVTEFDFAEKQLYLYKKAKDIKDIADYTAHDIKLENAIPRVTLECTFLDGSKITGDFLFDSGANLGILFNTPFSEKHQLEDKFDKKITISSRGLTATSTSIVGLTKSVSLLGNTFTEVPISLSQSKRGVSSQKGFAGILGAEIINRFDMILDYKKKKLYLKPNSYYKDAFEVPLVGFTIKKSGENIVIGDVIKDTEAATKGIQSGDQLLAINGTAHTDLKTYRKLLKKEGQTIRIQLKKSSGKEDEIELKLERLL
ncbi:aspartyl protease family protein [uncultured Dokdonia sp.]|uniref:aspartyl protease family protein n=1 Tax=uncultured Dokdonia sp. TaxID=575653 RepID=UPI00262152F7|nr:aspartyl protease family protein [uncultured Dokdonia sp.]